MKRRVIKKLVNEITNAVGQVGELTYDGMEYYDIPCKPIKGKRMEYLFRVGGYGKEGGLLERAIASRLDTWASIVCPLFCERPRFAKRGLYVIAAEYEHGMYYYRVCRIFRNQAEEEKYNRIRRERYKRKMGRIRNNSF